VLLASAWYPRFYTGLYCVDVPRNLFGKKKLKKSSFLILKGLVLETASLLGSICDMLPKTTKRATGVPAHPDPETGSLREES
jgi:hypothetical protein